MDVIQLCKDFELVFLRSKGRFWLEDPPKLTINELHVWAKIQVGLLACSLLKDLHRLKQDTPVDCYSVEFRLHELLISSAYSLTVAWEVTFSLTVIDEDIEAVAMLKESACIWHWVSPSWQRNVDEFCEEILDFLRFILDKFVEIFYAVDRLWCTRNRYCLSCEQMLKEYAARLEVGKVPIHVWDEGCGHSKNARISKSCVHPASDEQASKYW